MLSKNTKVYSIILLVSDFFALLAAFGLAYIIRVALDERNLLTTRDDGTYLLAALAIIPVWMIVLAVLGLYSSVTYNRRLSEWGKVFMGSFIGILLVIGFEYVTNQPIFPARLVTVYVFIGSFFLIVFAREIVRFMRSYFFRRGRGTSRVLIIGNSSATKDIAERLSNTASSGYHIVAVAGPKRYVPAIKDVRIFTALEDALSQVETLDITTIIQTDLYDDGERNQQILSTAQVRHINYSFIPGEPEFYAGKNTVDVFLGYPIITVSQTALIGWGAVAKRIFDIFASILLIIILSPVLLLISLLQLIFNPGPLLFKHERLTKYSKPFTIYKFRSMIWKYCGQDAETIFKEMNRDDLVREYRRDFKVLHDPRITRFGKFLRNTSLDELPQLFNVLKGDLSLVGPRPIPASELDAKFTKSSGALLLSVKSGVTGLWQVSGRNDLSTEQRVQLELYYVQNWSFWLDIKILFKTVLVVIKRTGVR
jgi:exopolysaccharide biosynthesis polyprenyl glycosylphosphotransferase